MSVVVPEPRELSDEEQQARAEKCTEIQDRIVNAMYHTREGLWELAKALFEFNEESGWTALGFATQREWLAQPEITMTKTEYSRLVRRYRELVMVRQLPVVRTDDGDESQVLLAEIEPSKLDIVLPAIERGEVSVAKALADAKEMGARDLRIVYGKEEEPALPDIEGHAVEVTENGTGESSREEKAALKLAEQLSESAGMVDSWLEYGGDRRKARRHLTRLTELHPVFEAMRLVEACIGDVPLEGQDAPPAKEDALVAWHELLVALRLQLPEA